MPTSTVLHEVRTGLTAMLNSLTTDSGIGFDVAFPNRPDLDARTEPVFAWTEILGYNSGQRMIDASIMHRWSVVVVGALYATQVGHEPNYANLAGLEDQFGPAMARSLGQYVTANVSPAGSAGNWSVQRTELQRTEWDWFETKGQKLFRLLPFEITIVHFEHVPYVIPA